MEEKSDASKGNASKETNQKHFHINCTKEFKRETKKDALIYALVARESSEQNVEIPCLVEPVFNEFQGVFPKDLPERAPSYA